MTKRILASILAGMFLFPAITAADPTPPGLNQADYTLIIQGCHIYGTPRLLKGKSVTAWVETRTWHPDHTRITPYWRWYMVWPDGNEALIKDWSTDYWVVISFDRVLFTQFLRWGVTLFDALATKTGLYKIRGEVSTEYRPPGGHASVGGQGCEMTFILFGG